MVLVGGDRRHHPGQGIVVVAIAAGMVGWLNSGMACGWVLVVVVALGCKERKNYLLAPGLVGEALGQDLRHRGEGTGVVTRRWETLGLWSIPAAGVVGRY